MSRPPAQPTSDSSSGTEGPAVGNVLGFSLLFRERKALLAVARRGLAPGVRVRDYEAEIPNVSFPLRGALQATRFRHRRCRAVQATLVIEARAIEPALHARLVGANLAGFRVETIALDLRAQLPGARTPRPTLQLAGRGPDGGVAWFQVALGIEPHGRLLRLRPTHLWFVGELEPGDGTGDPAGSVWRALIPRLAPHAREAEGDGALRVDAARLALTGPFVRTGWKAPDLELLGIETVALGARAVTIELRQQSGEAPVSVEPDPADPIGDLLARIHAHRRDPAARGDILELLAELGTRLPPGSRARLALARWSVQLAQHHDRAACLAGLRAWLDARPSDLPARRLLATTLGRNGEDRELARLLVAERRVASDPLRQDRLELALVSVLVERLEEPRGALALLRPCIARLRARRDPGARAALADALLLLAQARIVDAALAGARAGHAQAPLDEALDLIGDAHPTRRADMRAAVARTFARHGELEAALSLMGRALADDPGHELHLDLAIDYSLGLGEHASAVELLQLRLRDAPAELRAPLRRRLLGVLAELDDPAFEALTRDEVERALDLDPDDVEVLRLAVALEQRADQPGAAADHLARLIELEPARDRRVSLQLERAPLLDRAGRRDEAWDATRELLVSLGVSLGDWSGASPAEREASGADAEVEESARLRAALRLGLELGPATLRAELLDRFIATVRGDELGRALLERASTQLGLDAQIADLTRAAEALRDPGPALERLAGLAHDDLQRLRAVAELARARGAGEASAQIEARLGLLTLRAGLAPRAAELLAEAVRRFPARVDLRLALADALEGAGELESAARTLLALLEAPPPDAPPIPEGERVALARRVGAIAARRNDDALAVRVLKLAWRRRPPEGPPSEALEAAAEELFSALFRLGRSEDAEALASELLEIIEDERRAHWLLRAALVSPDALRLARLEEACATDPLDEEIAAALEAELRARGQREALEGHLRRRLALVRDPGPRAAVLDRLANLLGEGATTTAAAVAPLLEELVALDPAHVEARLALAHHHEATGQATEAHAMWREAASLLAPDDPRLVLPALRLGRQALRDEALADAEQWFRAALHLHPAERDALLGLHEAGRLRGDARAILDAAGGLLRLGEAGSRRAELELECARAHVELEEGQLAFERFKRAAAEATPRSALHLEIAEAWLELARRRDHRGEVALARAQLRRALGPDLPLEELLEEVRLLADELGAVDEAIELVELALVRHEGAATVLALLERVTERDPLRRLDLLRSVIDQMGVGEARDRVAGAMVSVARVVDDAAAALLALDRMQPATAELDPQLEARQWAITSLGRVDEERAEIEARLCDPDTPLSPALMSRFRACFDADDPAPPVALRLLELAPSTPPARGASLAEQALGALESARLAVPAAAGVEALRLLAPRGKIPRARWQGIEEAVFAEGDPALVAALVSLAGQGHRAGIEHLAGRDRSLLERGLAMAPRSAELHARLRDQLTRGPEGATEARGAALRGQLEAIARRRELGDPERAALFVGSAQDLDEDEAIALLEAMAAAEAARPAVATALLDELERRGAWEAAVRLRARLRGLATSPEAWIGLADRAEGSSDPAEAEARAHAGLALAASGELATAVPQLRRSLALAPDRAEVSLALGRALEALDRPVEALEVLAPLARTASRVLAAGIDHPRLCLDAGRLALRVGGAKAPGAQEMPGAHDLAVELLTLARRLAPDRAELRREASEALIGVLAGLGRRRDAARLAEATAEEHFTDLEQAARWLDLSADQLDDGVDPGELRRVLRRRLELTPRHEPTLDRLEALLGSLGDREGLGALLERRLAEVDLEAVARAPARPDPALLDRISRLAALLDDEALSDADAGHEGHEGPLRPGRDALRTRLHGVLAAHATDPVPSGLTLAELVEAQGQLERATELRRALVEAQPDDPRVLPAAVAAMSWCADQGPIEAAGQLAHRALALGSRAPRVLRGARQVGKLLSDHVLVREGTRGLLDLPEGPGSAGSSSDERASLWLDLADAELALGRPEAALAAFERGAVSAERSSEAGAAMHREIVERWLALLSSLDAPAHAAAEASARAHLRLALGDALPRADRIAEIDLLLEALDRIEPAIERTIEALVRHPGDAQIGLRLRRACARSEAGDRHLRALREVIDRLGPAADPAERDHLLVTLATAARELEGARTALRAVDELSERSAGTEEMLDLRDWAVRKLGRVEEELASIEARLVEPPPDPLAVTRLFRTLESDAERCARRLIALATDADAEVASWLCMRAVELSVERAPDDPTLVVDALEAAAAVGVPPPQRLAAWLDALPVLATRAPPELAARASTLTLALGPDPRLGEARDALLAVQLEASPEHPALAQALGAMTEDDAEAAHRWLETHASSVPALDRHLLALARQLDPVRAQALLAQHVAAHPPAPQIGPGEDPLLDGLFELGASAAIEARVHAHLERTRPGAEHDTGRGDARPVILRWRELAALEAEAERRGEGGPEGRARLRRSWLAVAELEGDREARIEALASALAVDDGAAERVRLAELLAEAGRHGPALEALAPLAAKDPATHGVRAGELALAAGQPTQAATLWRTALPELNEPSRAATAARLFELSLGAGDLQHALADGLAEADRLEAAGELAGAAAWLARVAELPTATLDGAGVPAHVLLQRAMSLDPSRPGLLRSFETALEAAGELEALRQLLARTLRGEGDDGAHDPGERDRRLRRWLSLLDAAPPEERREALELAHGRWPEDTALALDLAAARAASDDLTGALRIWQGLDASAFVTPELAQPAMALARDAQRRGDLEAARDRWDLALRCDPAALEPWRELRRLAAELDDPELGLRAVAAIGAGDPALERAARADLERERAELLVRLGRPKAASEAFAAASALTPTASAAHVALAERWLALVTSPALGSASASATPSPEGDPDTPVPAPDADRAAAQLEARARAELRAALGDELPTPALRAEARLLALRLHAADEALLLVRERVLAAPHHEPTLDLLIELADELATGDPRIDALDELSRLAEEAGNERDRLRLSERLAFAARDRGAADVALRALDGLPPDRQGAPQLMELRAWAVRRAGRTEQEAARLGAELGRVPAEGVEPLATQLLELLDDALDPWAGWLLDAARERRDPEGRRALALALITAAQARGDLPLLRRIDALALAVEAGLEDLAEGLELTFRGVIDADDPALLRRALPLFARTASASPHQVSRLVEAAWSHQADDPLAHQIAAELAGDPKALHEHVERFAAAQAITGAALGRLWVGAAAQAPGGPGHAHPPEAARVLEAVARVGDDRPAIITLLRRLERLDAWPSAVAGWVGLPGGAGRDELERLLDATADAPHLHAQVAEALAEVVGPTEPEFAAQLIELALDLRAPLDDPEAEIAQLAALRRRLGRALAEAGRSEAALEHLLPLAEQSVGSATPGATEEAAADDLALAIEVCDLLAASGRHERALPLLELLWTRGELPEAARRRLPEQLALARDAAPEIQIRTEVHVEAYAVAARRDKGPARVRWLMRAGELASPEQRIALFKEAARAAPDDAEIAQAYAEALAEAGERRELEALLRRRLDRELAARSTAEDPEAATTRAAATARQLLALVDQPGRQGEAVALHEILLRLSPRDIDAWLRVAALRSDAGDRRGADEAWRRAVELGGDDDRAFDPALALAEGAAERGDPAPALAMIDRALAIRPGDRGALELRLELGLRFGRADAVLAATEALLDTGPPAEAADEAAARARLLALRARALDDLDEPSAPEAWIRATRAAPNPAQRVELTREWVERAQARHVMGGDAREELRARATLLEARLEAAEADTGRVDLDLVYPEIAAQLALLTGPDDAGPEQLQEACEFIERWLERFPGESRLLDPLKELSLGLDGGLRHVAALERAIEASSPGEALDDLAVELAYAAVELVDPERLLTAMGTMSAARAAAPELLDLREWAVRQLGRVDHELSALDEALAGPDPLEALVPRLLRMVESDALRAATRIFGVAQRNSLAPDRQAALLDEVFALSIAQGTGKGLDLAILGLEYGAGRAPAFDPLRSLRAVEQAAFEADDPGRLANLVAVTLSMAASSHPELAPRGAQLLGLALLRYPDAPALHRVLLEAHPEGLAAAEAALEAVASGASIRGHTAARMWGGFAGGLERAEAAELLARRAELALRDDPDAFTGLLDALSDRKHWPDVMRLLELRVETSEQPDVKVAALKQLAHVRADILGDQATAIRVLEAALEHAPRDPDLLLPLLDHSFAQRDLGPAIELSVKVLEHVPMGDMAFAALGHRAADAALARGEHERAEALLARVLSRIADDERTRRRLEELRAVANDAEHKIRMLAAIANRQTGNARIDALEERARLLVSAVDRPDEAIDDLETVIAEAPDRRASVQLLDELYIRRERWSSLVQLLERDYTRHAGPARARVLERVAQIHADRLFDPARAEQALRLALEQLGAPNTEPANRELADRIYLQMARALDRQGRYAELAELLSEELAHELAPGSEVTPSDARIELMAQLARVLRDHVEDEAGAARAYERLEQLGRLPEEGLATLARWYRAQHRHEDLVRVLIVRAQALGRDGDLERKAELDRRIGELLDGPLRRPHEAAHYFLDAYLASPQDNPAAGSRARVLLAGTDSVVNVRHAVIERLPDLDDDRRAYGLVLLAELLAPQESFELEAEHRFEEALELDPELGPAHDGLGRLRARQGRLEEAVGPLVLAVRSPGLEAERAADTAAVAARALLELHRAAEAESVLRDALERYPSGQRALLELARLYSRTGRPEREAEALDRLSALSLSSMLRAEVAYRRAMLLEADFSRDPFSDAGEQARTLLLEAVGADAMHAHARQVLLDLASARSEWSIVAHMYFLTVRELPPGPSRALTHLDLAQVYLDRLHDAESAARNLASALAQPTTDLVVRKRAHLVASKLPDPDRAARLLSRVAAEDTELDDEGRARLFGAAAELHLRGEDAEATERALATARALPSVSAGGLAALDRIAEMIGAEDFELKKQRSALLRLLEEEEHPVERLHILGRLIEIGRALPDPKLLDTSSRQLIELAHGMLDTPAERESALLALRDLFAERGDFGRLVALYEELAASSTTAEAAADMLVDAARFAWTGMRDGKLAVAILGRALRRAPDHRSAISLLGDMAAAEDLRTETALLDELDRLDAQRLDPALVLRFAALARRLGRSDRARQLLRALLTRSLPPEQELEALTELDRLVVAREEPALRLELLVRRLELAERHAPDRVPALSLELAQAQHRSGAVEAARRSCGSALEAHPSNVPLARLYADLLEESEDWPTLSRVLEHLGAIAPGDEARADWLTRAARVHLEHDEDPAEAMASARRLLIRAREVAREHGESRATMIPLAFAEQRWDEVLELTIELRALGGDDDEALLFGAVAEALVHGRRTVARSIGARHGPETRTRLLWPALARVAEKVAHEGPLPRLDAVLGAAAALTGTTEEVREELTAWTAGRSPAAGTALILARIHEACGEHESGTLMYQLAAFLAPGGPVPDLVERLPAVALVHRDPLHDPRCIPLAWRGALREVLIALRGLLAGIRAPGGDETVPRHAIERAAVQTAGRLVADLRDPLGMTIPVKVTGDPLHAGVGIRNRPEPMVVVSEELTLLPDAERAFRMAMAAAAIASGLAMVTDTHPLGLADLLDAIARFGDADSPLESSGARYIADALAARGLRAAELDPELRAALTAELAHWRRDAGTLDQLVTTVRRATTLLALRLCGRLDGALLTLARDQGVLVEGEHLDGRRILRSEDVQWLLRELGLTGGESRSSAGSTRP